MGTHHIMMIKRTGTDKHILCQRCGPAPGWGWDVDPEYMFASWRDGTQLPPAGNGYPVNGKCKNCEGTGITPLSFTEIL